MSDDEYNDYGDEDFEDFEASGAITVPVAPKASTTDQNSHHTKSSSVNNSTTSLPKKDKPPTPRATSSNSDDYDPDNEDENENLEDQTTKLLAEMGGVVDLESYLKNMLSSPAANEDNSDEDGEGENENNDNKELQPLTGVQPEDAEQRRLQAKLGYSPDKKIIRSPGEASPSPTMTRSSAGSALAAALAAPSQSNLSSLELLHQYTNQQTQQSKTKALPHHTSPNHNHNNSSHAHPSAGDSNDHVAHLLALAQNNNNNSNQNLSSGAKHASDAENALKVDALLRDLFPDRYKDKETPVIAATKQGSNKSKKKNNAKKAGNHPQQQYGLGVPRLPNNNNYEEEDNDEEYGDANNDNDNNNSSSNKGSGFGTDLLGGLEQQLKMLKKELKSKDEKIMRLTEHSMMMANQMDKFRGEIARLNARLHEAQMEIETKEARLVEATRKKKKDAKKKLANNNNGHMEEIGSGAAPTIYEAEILRLKEREQALMDAVEELSSQNEDLIIKLRESMQRELELSSKRAQLVSHNVHREGGHILPSIHEKSGGQVLLRAQTEPSTLNNNNSNNNNNHHGGNYYNSNEENYVKPAGKKKKKHSSG